MHLNEYGEVQKMYEQAVKHLNKWEMPEAENILVKLLEEQPDYAEAWNKLGVVCARQDDYNRAAECFEEAIKQKRSLASAYSNLGNIYQQKGWLDQAVKIYKKAIEIDPEHPTAHHNLGVLYKKSGKIHEGITLLKKATKLESSKPKDELKIPSQKGKYILTITIIITIILLYTLFSS